MMEPAVSKAQLEVWAMKEAVYDKIKYLPKSEIINFIIKDTEETINRIKKKLKISVMKKSIIVIFVVINCILNLSFTTGNKRERRLSARELDTIPMINILFSYKNQYNHDMRLDIIEGNELTEGINFTRFTIVNHVKYIEVLNEIKRIYCLNDSNEISRLSIQIDIRDKSNLIERLRLNRLSQLKEYLIMSDKLFGSLNFMPFRDSIK